MSNTLFGKIVRPLAACVAVVLATDCLGRPTGPSYTITDLGPLGGTSDADAVNERGQIAGRRTAPGDVMHPTIWLPEPTWGMPAGANDLGLGRGRVYGMNDAGQCVGFLTDDSGAFAGFRWDPEVGATDLGTLGGDQTIARAINNDGFVTGDSYTSDPDELWHAFLHDGTRMIDLGTLGGNRSWGQDVNTHGQVIGESYVYPEHPHGPTVRSYLWLPEPAYGLPAGMNAIDDYSSEHDMTSWARGINDRGQICGSVTWFNSLGQSVNQLALWLPESDYGLPAGWTDLRGVFDQRMTAFPKDINNKGVLVSRAVIDDSGPLPIFSAVMWVQGQWFDLHERIPLYAQSAWDLGSAQEINDRGHIVGWGIWNGQWHGYLLTPTYLEELPPCAADIDGNRIVDLADLIALLAAWGPCGQCPEDLDDSGTVDIADVLVALGSWGVCDVLGACCFPVTGDCESMAEAECTFYGGAWSPGECGTDSCAQPALGACCFYPITACDDLSELECIVQDGTWQGAASTCDDVECPVPPQGDRMDDPLIVTALPFSDERNSFAFDHWYDEVCNWTSDSPDVVYAYTPARDEVLRISTCAGSRYDTKLFVYENVEGNTVACNDDSCTTPFMPDPFVARIDALPVFAGSTYYIIVDGWGGWGGIYTLDIDRIDTGACCLPDGTCHDSSEGDCVAENGTWFAGEHCESFECPPLPRGACCLSSGSCVANQTEWNCEVVFGGTWQGEGVSCAEAECGGSD